MTRDMISNASQRRTPALRVLVLLVLCVVFLSSSEHKMRQKGRRMKVEIWSDVVCPWCYIGKRRFEQALSKFENQKYLDIEWKSYQLDPEMETDTSLSIHEYLASRKGITMGQAIVMGDNVARVAQSVGLTYHLDKTIPVNTINAHRLLHFAKTKGRQNEMKEQLLNAYFTQGKNLDDYVVLVDLASGIGLDSAAVREVLESNNYRDEVREDIVEGVRLGLRGVPFFVFDRKYGISGAQETDVFTRTLEKSFTEWLENNPQENLQVINGKVCTPDGKCD